MATPTKTSTTKTKTTKTSTAQKGAAQGLAAQNAAYAAAFKNYQALANRFTPQGVGAQMNQVKALYPDYSGNVYTDSQLAQLAQKQVGGVVGPQITNIADLYARRGRQGAAAISNLTNAYTGRLHDWADQVAQANAANLAESQGMGAALADFTRNRNASLQGDLNSALAGINAAPGLVAETAGATSGLGNTAAVGTAALGTSTAQRMAQEALAANTYAALQPSFAVNEGQNNLAGFQAQINDSMAKDLGDVRAQIPQLTLSVYQNLLDNNNSQRGMKAARGNALLGAYGDMQTNALNTNIAGAAVAENLARMAQQSSSDWLSALTSITNTDTSTNAQLQSSNPTLTSEQKISTVADTVAKQFGDYTSSPLGNRYLDQFGKPTQYALNNPGMVLKQVEAAIRKSSGGAANGNAGMVHRYALDVMRSLGLPSSRKAVAAGKVKAAATVGNPGDSANIPNMSLSDAIKYSAPASYGEGWNTALGGLLTSLWGG